MYIYSGVKDRDLLILSEINIIGNLFELIGIYKEFGIDNIDNKDIQYDMLIKRYDELGDNHKEYHYRNIGEKDIKYLLECNNVYVPRRDFRHFGKTWHCVPVITSINSYLIFDKVIERVHNDVTLWKVANEKIFPANNGAYLSDILTFQYQSVIRYLTGEDSNKKIKVRHMLFNWESNKINNLLGT